MGEAAEDDLHRME